MTPDLFTAPPHAPPARRPAINHQARQAYRLQRYRGRGHSHHHPGWPRCLGAGRADSAGADGCTPITHVGPRWSRYVWKLRTVHGLDVETITEPHDGRLCRASRSIRPPLARALRRSRRLSTWGRPMSDDDFKWYDEFNRAVVLRAYGSIAVHENPFGDVVVRQERDALEDEDHWVAIPVQDAEHIANAIIRKAAEIKAAPPPVKAATPKQPEAGTRTASSVASPRASHGATDHRQAGGGMMAAFADAAPAWAAAGIAPLPVYPDGKKTMVKHPEAFGRPAAMGLAAKPRYAAANLGFMCGGLQPPDCCGR